jgi:adenylate cyclase class IV
MNEFSELEFKYRADGIALSSFLNLMKELPVTSQKDVSSWDHYATNDSNKEEFLRFRESDEPELTIKRKTNQNNNWQRVEVDLPIEASRFKVQTINKFIELLGYKPNTSIYKTCFIRWLEYINFVYYIVYDEDMNEKGKFIEIEFNKSKLPEHLDKVAGQLKYGQEVLAKLGLTPQNRLKKSLFEIFVK